MDERFKKSFDTYFTARGLPSKEAKERMLQHSVSKLAQKNKKWLPATIGLILVSCLLLLIYVNPLGDLQTAASIDEIEEQLAVYMSEKEIAEYTALFEEDPIRLFLIKGHPLTKSEIEQLEQMGINVEQQFVWPRFPFSLTFAGFFLSLLTLGFVLYRMEKARLKAYTPFILSVYSTLYCGLGMQVSEGYSGMYYVFILWLVIAVGIGSVLSILIWEWQNKKA